MTRRRGGPLWRQRFVGRLLPWFFGLCLLPSAGAYAFDGAAFLKLPRHCQGYYANMVGAGQLQGVVVDLSQYEMNLAAMLGSASGHLNQYCPALVALVREVGRDRRGDTERPDRKKVLKAILSGFEAQVDRTDWNEFNTWFKSEVLTNAGRVLAMLGEQQEAVKDFEDAIETFPGYVPAYWELAKIHEENDDVERALAVLNQAKQIRLPKAARERIDERIQQLDAITEAQ